MERFQGQDFYCSTHDWKVLLPRQCRSNMQKGHHGHALLDAMAIRVPQMLCNTGTPNAMQAMTGALSQLLHLSLSQLLHLSRQLRPVCAWHTTSTHAQRPHKAAHARKGTPAALWTLAHTGVGFYLAFYGECDGSTHRYMYSYFDGTEHQRAARCSAACRNRTPPLDGKSWVGFEAKGFIVDLRSGRCYCESSDSAICKKKCSSYIRYSWGEPPTAVPTTLPPASRTAGTPGTAHTSAHTSL